MTSQFQTPRHLKTNAVALSAKLHAFAGYALPAIAAVGTLLLPAIDSLSAQPTDAAPSWFKGLVLACAAASAALHHYSGK